MIVGEIGRGDDAPGTPCTVIVCGREQGGLELDRGHAEIRPGDDEVVQEHQWHVWEAPRHHVEAGAEPRIELGGPEPIAVDDTVDREGAAVADLCPQQLSGEAGGLAHLLAHPSVRVPEGGATRVDEGRVRVAGSPSPPGAGTAVPSGNTQPWIEHGMPSTKGMIRTVSQWPVKWSRADRLLSSSTTHRTIDAPPLKPSVASATHTVPWTLVELGGCIRCEVEGDDRGRLASHACPVPQSIDDHLVLESDPVRPPVGDERPTIECGHLRQEAPDDDGVPAGVELGKGLTDRGGRLRQSVDPGTHPGEHRFRRCDVDDDRPTVGADTCAGSLRCDDHHLAGARSSHVTQVVVPRCRNPACEHDTSALDDASQCPFPLDPHRPTVAMVVDPVTPVFDRAVSPG